MGIDVGHVKQLLKAAVISPEYSHNMRSSSKAPPIVTDPSDPPGTASVSRTPEPGRESWNVSRISEGLGNHPALLVIVATALYGLLQVALLVARPPAGTPAIDQGINGEVVLSILPFVGVFVPTMVLALQGRRWLLAGPFVVQSIVLPALLIPNHLPRPLGLGWWPPVGTSLTSSAWTVRPLLGVLVEAILVLLPAFWAARAGSGRATQPQPPFVMRLAALTLVVFGLLTYVQTAQVIGSFEPTSWSVRLQLTLYFLLGALAGTRRAKLAAWVIVAPFVLTADSVQLLLPMPFSPARYIHPALPFLLATIAGLLWRPLAVWFGQLRDRSPRTLLTAVLLLNLADVVFTMLLTSLDGAVEANPFVRAIGLPAKLALVSVAALIVARIRPAALIWPVIVMLGVAVWHGGGLMLTTLT